MAAAGIFPRAISASCNDHTDQDQTERQAEQRPPYAPTQEPLHRRENQQDSEPESKPCKYAGILYPDPPRKTGKEIRDCTADAVPDSAGQIDHPCKKPACRLSEQPPKALFFGLHEIGFSACGRSRASAAPGPWRGNPCSAPPKPCRRRSTGARAAASRTSDRLWYQAPESRHSERRSSMAAIAAPRHAPAFDVSSVHGRHVWNATATQRPATAPGCSSEVSECSSGAGPPSDAPWPGTAAI